MAFLPWKDLRKHDCYVEDVTANRKKRRTRNNESERTREEEGGGERKKRMVSESRPDDTGHELTEPSRGTVHIFLVTLSYE